MSSLTSDWVYATIFGLAMAFVVFFIFRHYSRRVALIIKDTLSITDLMGQKLRLDSEMEQSWKSLDKNQQKLRKLEEAAQHQESLNRDLANMSGQVAREQQRRDEYTKETSDLQNIVSNLTQNVTDLTAIKQHLDAEIEQYRKSLDENREALQKIQTEYQQHEPMKQDLANLSGQVTQEKQKIDEYRKEAEELQNVISTLTQERERLESEKEDLKIQSDVARKHLDDEEEGGDPYQS